LENLIGLVFAQYDPYIKSHFEFSHLNKNFNYEQVSKSFDRRLWRKKIGRWMFGDHCCFLYYLYAFRACSLLVFVFSKNKKTGFTPK